jgi:hypothetical protein
MRAVQLAREAFEDISPPEPMFNVKLTMVALVGDRVYEPGSTVKTGEVQARALIKNGGAVGSLLSPSTMLFETPPEEEPAPPARERGYPTTIRVLRQGFYDPVQGRSFAVGKTPEQVYCDLPWQVLSDPDIPLASRRGNVVEIVSLDSEGHRRLIEAKKREQAGLPTSGQPTSGTINRFGASIA